MIGNPLKGKNDDAHDIVLPKNIPDYPGVPVRLP
jgi:hypothetical protein